jgi:hypothetical protein
MAPNFEIRDGLVAQLRMEEFQDKTAQADKAAHLRQIPRATTTGATSGVAQRVQAIEFHDTTRYTKINFPEL